LTIERVPFAPLPNLGFACLKVRRRCQVTGREIATLSQRGGLKMALFVLGAGATRGASFVNPAKNPCLPPLDLDFYAQLQRIANSKHRTHPVKAAETVIGSDFDCD
jgi:hypothetical protein